jgi:small-conductance mechanosensitive channel
MPLRLFDGWLDRYGDRVELVLISIAIVLAAAALILILDRALHRLLRRLRPRIQLPSETILTIGRAVSLLLWVAVGFLLLSFWGIAVSGLWTGFVSVAAVIGVGFLAVWTMISNVTASLFITMWRPFHLGAVVELLPENLKGRVVDRNLMFTVLREDNECALFIPNNLFFQKMFRVSARSDRSTFEFLEFEDQPPVALKRAAGD